RLYMTLAGVRGSCSAMRMDETMSERDWAELEQICRGTYRAGIAQFNRFGDTKSLVHSINSVNFTSGEINIHHHPTNLPSESSPQLEELSERMMPLFSSTS